MMKIDAKRKNGVRNRMGGMSRAFQLAAVGVVFALVAATADAEPQRVLVCSVTAGHRHGSIPYVNRALEEIAEGDDRFEVVGWIGDAEELDQLAPDALRRNRIDVVIFNNTSGDLPLPDLDGFVEWIEAGGGFVGIHAASDTLKGEARYTEMLQGVFDGHGPQVEATLHAGDTEHPAHAGIGETWHLPREEIYLHREHDREKVNVLWYMRHHPNHRDREGYYPIAWSRMAGEGRVFYTALGHRNDLVSIDPDMNGRVNPVEVAEQFRAHVLGGIVWALGIENQD